MKKEAYIKVLSDLKVMMKKKMLEDKQHKNQHKDMAAYEKEEKEDYDDDDASDLDKDYRSDFMKNKGRSKPKGTGLMVMIAEAKKSPIKKSSGRKKKSYG